MSLNWSFFYLGRLDYIVVTYCEVYYITSNMSGVPANSYVFSYSFQQLIRVVNMFANTMSKIITLFSDESRKRTVFEVRLIDGPLVLSTVQTAEPRFRFSCAATPKDTRFLFDSFGPVIEMEEDRQGCWKHRVGE